jgi:hypothetical protein
MSASSLAITARDGHKNFNQLRAKKLNLDLGVEAGKQSMHHASEERKHVKIFALITAECRFQGPTEYVWSNFS